MPVCSCVCVCMCVCDYKPVPTLMLTKGRWVWDVVDWGGGHKICKRKSRESFLLFDLNISVNHYNILSQ